MTVSSTLETLKFPAFASSKELRKASVFVIVEIEIPRLVNVFRYGGSGVKKTKTYNRRDSQMVTHSSTSRPVQCSYMAERTECFYVTLEVRFQVSRIEFLDSGSKTCWLGYVSRVTCVDGIPSKSQHLRSWYHQNSNVVILDEERQ